MSTDIFQRKLTAILSADVVGYSRLMGDDEAATVKTLETYKGVMFSLIKQHRGRVVDSPGDNLLAEFGSVVDAVQCAVSIQKELQTRNADLSDNRRMEFRIGINLGDVIEEEDRIYGDGVNIAARLEALADPGGICVSKTAFDHIESKLPLGYEFLGEQTVKNIPKPIGAYRVLMEPRVTAVKGIEEKKAVHFWPRKGILSLGIIVILAIAAVLYWNFYLRGPSIEPASIERMAYPLPEKPSIAVLPFTNMSGDPKQDYIGDGLSEIIRNALSVSSQMFVMDRNATITYKGTPVKPQQVAEDLGVQYILDGSIHKSGNQLRVTAQLIDALNGHQLWSDVYDREMRNLFDLHDEITKKIMVSLQVVLSGSEEVRVYAKSTDNLEAWKNYIKGVELYENFNAKDNLKAREYFKSAIELDPTFVAALSKLAETHSQDFIFEWSDSPSTSMSRAIELAQKAVELDDLDPYAHAAFGYILLYQKQFEKAIIEAKRTITLNPNYSMGHIILAGAMYFSGQFEEAIILCKKAARLDPNPYAHFFHILSASYIFLGHYEEALEVFRQWEERAPPGSRLEAILKTQLSWLYQELGREEEARAYMVEALKIKPDYSLENIADDPYKDPAHLQRIQDAYRKAGMPEKPPGAVQEKSSIAVLPFDNLSSDAEQKYFVLGLSEEILNYISKIPNLHVTSKQSSFIFKDSDKTTQEIADILDREYLLEGSVRKAGNALRITAQLIRAADDSHIWAETYDRELKDIFEIQEDIANNVADKLKLTLESLKLLGGTENIDAYEKYLIAKGLRSTKVEMTRQALEAIDAAIDLDPEFALAWAEKARDHSLLGSSRPYSHFLVEIDDALKAAQKTIELEPNLGDGYAYLSYIKSTKKEWIEAEQYNQKALELIDESLSGDHSFILIFYMATGKSKRAYELLGRMRRNDPFNQVIAHNYYVIPMLLGDRQRAEEEYQNINKLLLKGYSDWNADAITEVRLHSGDKLSRDEIVSSNPINITLKEYLDSPKEGLMELRRIYSSNDNLSNQDRLKIISWASYFDDHEFAMEVIDDFSRISANLGPILWSPGMREVRKLPRFKEYVREIGLVDYWKKYGWPDLCRPVGDDDFVCK